MEEWEVEDAVKGIHWSCNVESSAGEAWIDECVAGYALIVELWELGEHVGRHVPVGFGSGYCGEEGYDGGVWCGGEGFECH